jgi:thymidylate synthase
MDFSGDMSEPSMRIKEQGVDQLKGCIQKNKENPTDRRIILSVWNPSKYRDEDERVGCFKCVSFGMYRCLLY